MILLIHFRDAHSICLHPSEFIGTDSSSVHNCATQGVKLLNTVCISQIIHVRFFCRIAF